MKKQIVKILGKMQHILKTEGLLRVVRIGINKIIVGIPMIFLFSKIPMKKIIMFESSNDFDGNSGALYEYLQKTILAKDYKFVWVVSDEKMLKRRDCICVYWNPITLKETLRLYYYQCVSEIQFHDNKGIQKRRKEQLNVYLSHGALPYKFVSKIYDDFSVPEYIDWFVSPSKECWEIKRKSWAIDEKRNVLYASFPRNDVFVLKECHELEKIIGNKKFKKIIVWTPTFRKSRLINRNDASRNYPFGIPIVYDLKELQNFNEFLKKETIFLIIKLHPMQIYDIEKYSGLTNICILTGKEIKRIHFYKMLTQTDALISDYSSIVFDYMLLNRPIAWTLDDLSEYNVDFVMENYLDYMPGHHIYNIDDLKQFCIDVVMDRDVFEEKRNALAERLKLKNSGDGCRTVARTFLQVEEKE